jgi:enoyl-CoA hydratase/carnithine racemase
VIATLTIDRPQVRNALDLDTMDRLHGELDTAEHARVVVLTGGGDKVFCAGADLAAVAANPAARRDAARRYAALLARLASFPRPVIARVNGHCLAGGLGLMLACDLAVATEDATFFLPEAAVGTWPMMVGALLVPVVGRRRALDLALTGRKLSAAEAEAWGMVQRVVPREELDAEVSRVAESVVARSPSAMRAGRAAWREAVSPTQEAQLAMLAERLGDVMDAPDAAEGFVAFVEKRPARWTED